MKKIVIDGKVAVNGKKSVVKIEKPVEIYTKIGVDELMLTQQGSPGLNGNIGGFTVEYRNAVLGANPYANNNYVIQTTASGLKQAGTYEWWFSDADFYGNDLGWNGTFYDAIVAASFDKVYIKLFDIADSSKMQLYVAENASIVNGGDLKVSMTRLGGSNTWNIPTSKIGVSFTFTKNGAEGADGSQGVQGIQGLDGVQGSVGSTGTGITFKGSLATIGDLPVAGQVQGDAYLIQTDDSLHIYDGSAFVDGGSIQGPQGVQGITGLQGVQGNQGIQGPAGNDGADGVDGIQGIQGPSGGIDGIDGADGLDGADGIDGVQGPAGVDGVDGVQGVQGIQGLDGAVGPAGLNWQGLWSVATSYVIDDAVSDGGSSYFCIADVTGGNSPFSNASWALLALRGATGPQGVQGVQGLDGAQGIQGVNAPNLAINDLTDGTTPGFSNVGLGSNVLSLLTTGSGNTGLGSRALSGTTEGFGNSAVGDGALKFNVDGSANTAVGSRALYGHVSGIGNVGIGKDAGANITTGSYNIMIGTSAVATSASASNQLNIGNLIYGDSSFIGIGVASPKAKLDVAGGVKVADDTEVASSAKVGTLRYREDANNSYVEMCMRTSGNTYEWHVIATYNF